MARLFYILVSSFVVLSVFFTATIVQHATDAEDFLHRRVLFEQLRTNNMELDLMHTRARADDVQRKLVAESNVVSELSATLHELQDQNEQLREQLEFAQEAVAELKRKQARFGSQTGLAATLVVDDEDDPFMAHPLVKNFQQGRIDWHDILRVPQPTRGNAHEEYQLHRLIAREDALAQFLSARGASRRFYERSQEHGPLQFYSLCRILSDGCLIHADKDECLRDSFCVWSSKAELCIQRNGNILRNYEAPKLFFPVQDRFDEYNSHASMYDAIQNRYAGRAVKNYQGNTMLLTECNVVIEEPAFPIQFTMERMFYHFINDNLSRLLNSIQEVMNPNPYERSSMSNHVVIAQTSYFDDFVDWFGFVSSNCWREGIELPEGTCFLAVHNLGQGKSSMETLGWVMRAAGVDSIPPPTEPVLGMVSRRNKRFILNEDELIRKARKLEIKTHILPLEHMTPYEQLKAFRTVNILFGVHGSGLTNAILLQPGSVMVQIVPYGMANPIGQSIVSVYSGYAAQARSGYVEWTNPDPTHTVLHWHFMEPAFAGKEAEVFRDNIMEAGPRGFWLMQDTILPVEDFEKLLFAARARLQYGLQ